MNLLTYRIWMKLRAWRQKLNKVFQRRVDLSHFQKRAFRHKVRRAAYRITRTGIPGAHRKEAPPIGGERYEQIQCRKKREKKANHQRFSRYRKQLA